MKKFLFSLILIGCSLFFLPLASGAENLGKLALTMPASKQAVIHWLADHGYSYQIIPEAGGKVLIKASKDEDKLEVYISPSSPLACAISTHFYGGQEESVDPSLDLLHDLQNKDSKTPAQTSEQQPEIPAAVLEKIGSVACLQAKHQGQVLQFSGVFIDDQGLIISTAHDLIEQEEVKIISTINTEFTGDIIKIDFERDLALIKLQSGKEEVVDLQAGRNLLGMGEKVYSIGCPIGLRGTISSGYINGPPRMVNNLALWQASMEIQPGSSGSPVFDANGALVALVKGRHRVAEEIAFLIPLEEIIDFLSEESTP